MKKKICVVTAARSEYGLLRWILSDLASDDAFDLRLVVTGTHLSSEYGNTVNYIEDDGFRIDERIDINVQGRESADIAYSLGICTLGFAEYFKNSRPDYLLILGDRYELLAISSVALVMSIPIVHISGGDITEGAIDNEVRNALSMMSTFHFPGVKESALRIQQMRNSTKDIYVVGEPGLDSFIRSEVLLRKDLANQLKLSISKKWILVTYHSETKLSIADNLVIAKNMVEALLALQEVEIIITKSNADLGGAQLNEYWESVGAVYPNTIKVYSSLGHARYLSFMRQAALVIGNSSSGIVEAPFLGIPVVNIGDRQKGRHLCRNVISSSGSFDSIMGAIKKAQELESCNIVDTYYGDGYTSQRIIKYLKSF